MVVSAGFGKSTLLAQAMAENGLDPRGVDVWVGCTPEDSVATHLAGRLLGALQADTGHRRRADAVAVICAEVRRRTPAEVAFLLDDADALLPGSSGARLLDDLLRALPINAHVVLAGRREPPVAWARFALAGRVAELREPDLAFTEEELTQFAQLRGVPRSALSGLAGWPALAELAATMGRERVTDFLWQEMLTPLPKWTRQLLAAIAAVGGADDEVASALAGRPVALNALLTGLPLITRNDRGWYQAHPLWHQALTRELTAAEVGQARSIAAHVLSRRGDLAAAVRLCLEAGAWDDVDRLIVENCQAAQSMVCSGVLGEWYRRLPPERHKGPAGWLLEGILLRATDARVAQAMLLRAGEAYQAAGDLPGVTACVSHAVSIAWWQRDAEMIGVLTGRVLLQLGALALQLGALAPAPAEEGVPDSLEALAGFVRLVQADVLGDAAAAIAVLESNVASRVSPEWQAVFDNWRGLRHLALGDPGRALWFAQRAATEVLATGRRGDCAVELLSLHLLGRQDDVLQRLPQTLAKPSGASESRVITHALAASVLAWTGRPEQATAHLRSAEDLRAGLSAPLLELLLTGARLAVALAAGDDDAVSLATRLGELRDGDGTTDRKIGLGRGSAAKVVDQWFLAVQYVLLPSTRPWWDEQPLPGCFAVARDLAHSMVALRRGEPVDRSHLPDLGVIRAFLPPAWVAELTASDGDRAALDVVGTPACRQAPVHIRLLGPVQLLPGKTAVADRLLRRRRVRELLAYLVIHRSVTRERVAADMWPDHEPVAAARNLRVTLTYLSQLLQPDHLPKQSPALLRRTCHRIELVESPLLTTDVWTVDRLLTEAAHAERQHAPSVALACYREALGNYGGSLVSDSSSPEWLLPHRERLQRRVVAAAVRAGELLLADGAIDEPLQLAQQALATDSWSEPAFQLLISVHLMAGDRSAARLALQDSYRMLDALGAVPDTRTQMLARRVISDPSQPSRGSSSPDPCLSG